MTDIWAVDRFWLNVRKTDTCWLWTGSTHPKGYGQFYADGKMHRAHRWAYEEFVGPISDGLVLDHVRANGCTSTSCVNYLDHLEPVTQLENVRRGDAGKHWAAKTHCPKDHEYNEKNTRVYRGKRHCRACDRERKR